MVVAKHYRMSKMSEKRTLPTIYEGKVASSAAPTNEEWRRLRRLGTQFVWGIVLLVTLSVVVSPMIEYHLYQI